ncbi:MAG: DUF1667 domain-containing protein [Candidatus Altiarchaeota archaeon]|nr:DUF1667 domain-containing protein [Candidatus Altiarchaeota archaeon]
MESKKYVCIICPSSCEIEAQEVDGVIKVKGNACGKGEEYVKKEMTSPERGLTTSVPVRGGNLPLVSVKTTKPIPKSMMAGVMKEVSGVETTAPVKIGDLIVKNILGTGADIVATKNINKET